MSHCDRWLETSFALYSRYFYPPAWMNISLCSAFHWIHGSPVTMGDSRHHVLSHPIKEHNSLSQSGLSSCGPISVFISVMQSRPIEQHLPSKFQENQRPELLLIRTHAHTLKYEHAHTRMHQQLTLPKNETFQFNDNRKWELEAEQL